MLKTGLNENLGRQLLEVESLKQAFSFFLCSTLCTRRPDYLREETDRIRPYALGLRAAPTAALGGAAL